ncbi:DUF1566 domain-containing protein [Sedimenticola sp.]|uniref:Lcl C-terminal domain-containing protein n=1 Tax=Sedimenticola sp. TaxID=1940285 RepID=UPI003D14A1E0
MRILGILFLSVIALVLSGCASITSSEMQSIAVSSKETTGEQITAAKCSIINDKGKWDIETPTVVSVHKSSQDLLIDCEKEGLKNGFVRAVSSASAGMYGNIIFGGVIGAVIDHSKGSGYEYPANISVIMGSQKVVYVTDQQIIQPVVAKKKLLSSDVNSNDNTMVQQPGIKAASGGTCARCLGEQSCPFIDNGDGTVKDRRNNRIWMRCSYGQQWDGETCIGDPKEITVWQAESIGKKLYVGNGMGWRIPYKSEMNNLILNACVPTINADVFPNTPTGEFATFDATQSNWHARYFNMKDGNSYNASHYGHVKSYIRFVRN